MLPTLVFPKTYGVKNFPMMARYPLERWQKGDYVHLTENDWRNFTSPIFISQTEADEWMSSATGQVHEVSRDRRRDARSERFADQSRPRARGGDRPSTPPPTNVRESSSSGSQDGPTNRVVSSVFPPSSRGLFGSSAFLGSSTQTTGGGLFKTHVLNMVEQPLTLLDGDCSK